MRAKYGDGEAQRIASRTDIYGLGCVLFELFTGRRAWPGENAMQVALARTTAEAPDPRSVRPILAAVASTISRCLRREPADRFNSVDEVTQALRLAYSAGAVSSERVNDRQKAPASGDFRIRHRSLPSFIPRGVGPVGSVGNS